MIGIIHNINFSLLTNIVSDLINMVHFYFLEDKKSTKSLLVKCEIKSQFDCCLLADDATFNGLVAQL